MMEEQEQARCEIVIDQKMTDMLLLSFLSYVALMLIMLASLETGSLNPSNQL